MIATESMLFLALLATYFFLRARPPTPGPSVVSSSRSSISGRGSSAQCSSGAASPSSPPTRRWHAVASGVLRVALALSFLLGAAFLVNTFIDFQDLHFGWDTNAYGSIYYVTVGLHAAHVLAGLMISGVVQYKVWRGLIDAEHHTSVEVFSLYWHFVDVVWLFVFSSLFISAHIR